MTSEFSTYLEQVANAYDALPPADAGRGMYATETERCYVALCRELLAQFDVLRAFVDVQFTESDPYANSASMFVDLQHYRTLRVFAGGEPIPAYHMLSSIALPSGHTYNHVFRAVHDGLAHYPGRYSFGPIGEYRAFLAHARLLSPDAIRALATETLGQNAYYNVHKAYAPQKFALLPQALIMRAFLFADLVTP
jgi:hypothetical protein